MQRNELDVTLNTCDRCCLCKLSCLLTKRPRSQRKLGASASARPGISITSHATCGPTAPSIMPRPWHARSPWSRAVARPRVHQRSARRGCDNLHHRPSAQIGTVPCVLPPRFVHVLSVDELPSPHFAGGSSARTRPAVRRSATRRPSSPRPPTLARRGPPTHATALHRCPHLETSRNARLRRHGQPLPAGPGQWPATSPRPPLASTATPLVHRRSPSPSTVCVAGPSTAQPTPPIASAQSASPTERSL